MYPFFSIYIEIEKNIYIYIKNTFVHMVIGRTSWMFAEGISGHPICTKHASSLLKQLINTRYSKHTIRKRFITQ